jgi:hypothetical protein
LRECPKRDQIFVQHLGLSLIWAFLFVLLISTISMTVAFPSLSGANAPYAVALASLIAITVFMIDRLFIQADWDWQATRQRIELARAAWESGSPSHAPVDLSLLAQGTRTTKRLLVIAFRVGLSAAIGLTVASFLELVIYKEEIAPLIQRLHYQENRPIYDAIDAHTRQIDAEIAGARAERDRLQTSLNDLQHQLDQLTIQTPPVPSDAEISALDSQIAGLRTQIADEQASIQRYAQDMIAEANGTLVNTGNSGVAGHGPEYLTALQLRDLAEQHVRAMQAQIAALDARRTQLVGDREREIAAAREEWNAQAEALAARSAGVADELARRQQALQALEAGRSAAVDAYVAQAEKRPDFVPLSVGIAAQFRALRTLYAEYGSTFEKSMLKLLIMLLEMTPVLQKVFMSPRTRYAVKLDEAWRMPSYDQFDREVERRQEHLRKKADAALDEELDRRGINTVKMGSSQKPTPDEGAT